LIELLIVIVIIGILAGIVIGLTGVSARRKANDAQRKADIHEMQNALEQYYVDNDAYPAALATLVPTYMQAVPDSPGANNEYSYSTADGGYTLQFTLENTSDTGPNIDAGVYSVTNKQ